MLSKKTKRQSQVSLLEDKENQSWQMNGEDMEEKKGALSTKHSRKKITQDKLKNIDTKL